jgi:predicted transcriptional regulator
MPARGKASTCEWFAAFAKISTWTGRSCRDRKAGFEVTTKNCACLIGSIGERVYKMTCARDVMTRPVICVRFDASVAEAARLMAQHGINGLPVLDASGKLVGIVTARDLLRGRGTGREPKRPRWPEFLVGLEPLPQNYDEFRAERSQMS